MKKHFLLVVCTFSMVAGALGCMPETRTIEFDTKQVTQPDVAVTPDGVERSVLPAAGIR
jgi:hypothetical protein